MKSALANKLKEAAVKSPVNRGFLFAASRLHQHYSLATTQSSSEGLCAQRMRLMMFSMRLS